MASSVPAATPPSSRRPLQREGAMYILTQAEQALQDAMTRSSSPIPEAVLGKRTHEEYDDSGDTEPDDGGSPTTTEQQTTVPSISNITAMVSRYAVQKRLRPEQRDEIREFLQDTTLCRQAKLFVSLLSIESKIDAFRSSAPPYQVSEELKTNINNYALAILLSVNISAYKGNIPRNHILDILKKFRFDLPAGIEHDYANWEKITTCVSYSLTQIRARLKKAIKDSLVSNVNIFALSQIIVHSTPCRVTVQLCGRVALMRAIYVECNGNEKYWNLIDDRLALIRKIAGTSTAKIVKAFNGILKTDRATYGAEDDYTIADVVPDEWQQRVDDVISGVNV